MKKTDLLTPGNPLRCVHGTWVERHKKAVYACKLDKDGNKLRNTFNYKPCPCYPKHVCVFYERQPRVRLLDRDS